MAIRVLIVDDEASVARSVNRLLLSEGFETDVVQSGDEALEKLRGNAEYNVVVSDQRMPKMSGAELFAIMQKEFPIIKRILLTGYTDLDSLRSAVNTGHIYRFLLKPWDDEELVDCVLDAASANHLASENIKLTESLKQLNSTLEEKIDQKTRVLRMNLNALERYEDIIEQAPTSMLCVSEEDMIVLANEAARDSLGFRTALEGLKYNEVLPFELVQIFDSFNSDCKHRININGKDFCVLLRTIKIKSKFTGRLVCFWRSDDDAH